jgi:hypothetical protein
VGEHRIDVFTQLRSELAAYESAEERYLYIPTLMDERDLDSSRDAIAGHHKMDMTVAGLQTPDHAGSSWMANVRKLSKDLHDHLREEKTIFLQLAGKILDDPAKSSLAKKYRKDYQRMQEKLAQG